ncbi:terminase small subunit [Bacillus gobiensis]|uniref:terminase small subunit n=1 Tax=Bacillus gobiensis TaxID=1441095 RepID=UPI003D1EB697
MNLTPKQQIFADSYIELGNAEKAAIKAGYSKSYARGNAHKLVANSGIKKYIEDRMDQLKSERVADQQEVLEFLTTVMRGEVTEQTLRGIGEGAQTIDDIEISGKDRIKAAELLGKRHAMWTDKQKIEGEAQVVIVNDLND